MTTITQTFNSFSSSDQVEMTNEKPAKVVLDEVEFHVKQFNINDTFFFNPCDVKSIASAIYLKHKGCQVRDVTANNTSVFQTGARISYLGFKPKTHIKSQRIVKKTVSESSFNIEAKEMDIGDRLVTRYIYSFNKFNEKETELEILEFVFNNIENALDWLHSSDPDVQLKVTERSGNYLTAVKGIKTRVTSYMELGENYLANGIKTAVNRCNNPKETLVMNRLAKLAGYTMWYEQCTSLGIIVYN